MVVRVHPCRLLHKVAPEMCQDSKGESRNAQKSETEYVVQKCKSVDEPEKQGFSDDDYDMSNKSRNSQTGTMESDAVHVEETESITQSRELIITCKLLWIASWCFLELIRKSSIFPLVEMYAEKLLFLVMQAKQFPLH